jgi:hypothetical protein
MKINSFSILVLLPLLLLASSTTAHAYTVVLRSGERVEIPDNFGITNTTLTYEIAPHINRTILLNSVDIAATEQANKEQPGSLLRRIEQSLIESDDRESLSTRRQAPPSRAPRATIQAAPNSRPTLTNKDLEAMRARGQASGLAYELQRRALPVESRDATAKRNAAELQLMREAQAQSDEQTAESEILWRTRAAGLREEFASLDAELNYWRTRLAEASTSSLTSLATPATTLIGVPPLATPYNYGGVVVGSHIGRPNFGNSTTIISTRDSTFGIQIGGRINLGGHSDSARTHSGRNRNSISLNGGYLRRDVRGVRATQHSSIYNGYTFGYVAPFGGYPYQPYAGYDLVNMRERIRELEAARVRLVARRRLLEEEARRAGASPGWLRP